MRLDGENIAVMIDATQPPPEIPGTFGPLGCARRFTLNKTRAQIDMTCGGDGNIVRRLGRPDFNATAEFVYDDTTVPALMDAADATTPSWMRFIVDNVNAPGQYWQGLFMVDASVDAAIGGPATITANLVAAGNVAFISGVTPP